LSDGATQKNDLLRDIPQQVLSMLIRLKYSKTEKASRKTNKKAETYFKAEI
jgi:hypothetical protein